MSLSSIAVGGGMPGSHGPTEGDRKSRGERALRIPTIRSNGHELALAPGPDSGARGAAA
jgi:hypothetical protein